MAAATIGAMPLILPRNILGANAPSKKIAVGIIGLGRQTQNINIPGFLSLANCRIVFGISNNSDAMKSMVAPR